MANFGLYEFHFNKKSSVIFLENKFIDFLKKGKFIKICFIYWALFGHLFPGHSFQYKIKLDFYLLLGKLNVTFKEYILLYLHEAIKNWWVCK